MPFSKRFLQLFDRLIPPGYVELQEYDIILRSRLTVTFIFLSSIASIYSGFAAPNNSVLALSHIGLVGLGLIFFLLLLFFRATGSFVFTANFYAIVVFVALCLSSSSFGGAMENPLVILMVIVPLVIFIIAGKYWGLFWTIINMLYYLASPYIQLHQQAPKLEIETFQFLQITAWLFLSACLFFILYIFDLLNAKLRHQVSITSTHFEYEAGHDKLTGLLNRSSFQQRLSNTLARVEANNGSAIFGLLDLDGFKPVNDDIGHHAGDIVLQVVAARLSSVIRNTDTLARLGGDEFAFILEDIQNLETVDNAVQIMLNTIAQPISIDGVVVQISGSIGLARCPEDSIDPDNILRAADKAMYEAKKRKGRFVHYKNL